MKNLVNKVWEDTKENIKSRRYFKNYLNDLLAGNLSRTPFYATIDNAVLGVSDEQVLGSVANSFIVSSLGYSVVYVFGNSMVAKGFGKKYQKHAKKIDAIYSSIMTFGLGMGVNLAAGYNLKQAITASAFRATLALPLGPLTRYYTDSFRDMRGEKPIAKDTNFRNKSWKYNLPRLAAMIAIPLMIMGGTLKTTPQKKEDIPNHSYYHEPQGRKNYYIPTEFNLTT